MERIKDLNAAIGKEILKPFLNAVKNGDIKELDVKQIGIMMDEACGRGSVRGVFEAKIRDRIELFQVMRFMLDRWYVDFIYKQDIDGRAEFLKILEDEDLGLDWLAKKMQPVMLTIGLPETHYRIPLLQKPSNVTASQAFPSKQSDLTCASNSVAKAVVEILDDFGFDCDQQQVINAFVDTVQPTGEAKNPSEFKGKRIKVHVTEKSDKRQQGKIEIELGVETQWGAFDDSKMTLSTIPVALDLKGKNAKMVVRWDIGITLSKKNIEGPHAIFAKDYDTATGNYSCINSWDTLYPTPMIHNTRIYAVDYISIIQLK